MSEERLLRADAPLNSSRASVRRSSIAAISPRSRRTSGSFSVRETRSPLSLAWSDSREYWTHTVRQTDRIGTPTLNTNQNISGALARLGLGHTAQFLLWATACVAVLVAKRYHLKYPKIRYLKIRYRLLG